MAEPILIWGAGAVGGTIGAYWVRAGEPVLLVDSQHEHVARCADANQGLTISGPLAQFQQPIPALTPEALTGRYRRIVLAVKAQHTATALDGLAPHLANDGYVLSAQNGLNELLIAERVGRERTVGCFVNFSADWLAPGEILYGNRGAVVVGELDGATRERSRELHRLLQLFEPDAVLTDDIWGYLWGKLCYGAMLFATALTPDSMAANFADPQRAPIWITLAREVTRVAAAQHVTPRGFNGFEPAAFAPDRSDDAAARASIAALAAFNRDNAKTHSGVWRDLAIRKRPTEVDAQLGIIVELGRQAGIDTPLLTRLIELVHDVEQGRLEQSAAALRPLIALCGSARH